MNLNRKDRISGLYAITPDEQDTVELLRKVRLVLLGGARMLQYRNKAADRVMRLEQASALRGLTREFGASLIINDDAMLAHSADADGVHLGGADGDLIGARDVLGSGRLIGMSCYNRLELARKAVRQGADYVAFGSFFSSIIKPDAVVAAPELLRQAKCEIAVPLVAIGGITPHNGELLLEHGADALAVISALFNAQDIQAVARQFANLSFH